MVGGTEWKGERDKTKATGRRGQAGRKKRGREGRERRKRGSRRMGEGQRKRRK